MLIPLKKLNKWCEGFAAKFSKAEKWEYYSLSREAWLEGFKVGREICSSVVQDANSGNEIAIRPANVGEELEEMV